MNRSQLEMILGAVPVESDGRIRLIGIGPYHRTVPIRVRAQR